MKRHPSKHILVSVPEWLHTHINDQIGLLGENKSEVMRTITISYLAEKGIIAPNGNNGG